MKWLLGDVSFHLEIGLVLTPNLGQNSRGKDSISDIAMTLRPSREAEGLNVLQEKVQESQKRKCFSSWGFAGLKRAYP